MLRTTNSSDKTQSLTEADKKRLRDAAAFHRQRLGITDQPMVRRGFLAVIASIWPAIRRGGQS